MDNIEIPDYVDWLKSHDSSELNPGEFIAYSEIVDSLFNSICENLVFENLPVMTMNVTTSNRLMFYFIDFYKNNAYFLGEVLTATSIQDMEAMNPVEFKEFIECNFISSRKASQRRL